MNEASRSSNSIKNISFGLATQVIQMILGFVSRWIFILYLDKEYLGVNQLFTEILTYLSLADLGIGNAILFSLYKPLANKDLPSIAGLMKYFKKIYLTIAGIVFVAGLCLMPFLHNIVKNVPEQLSNDLYLIYFLFLLNTTATYLLTYRFCLLHADQKTYILAKRNILIVIVQNILQIAVLIFTQNFILYLIVQIGTMLLGNYWNTFLIRKHYPFVEEYKNVNIDESLKKQIYSNAKSTAIVKVGGLVVNNSTSIILNYFSGLVMVGLLSNYNMLIALAAGVIAQVFAGLTGSIANVNAKESRQKKRETFHLINFANFWFYGTAAVLIVLLINDFIKLWIGEDFLLPLNVVVILALNFYLFGMQNAVWTFKSTLGFFKQGRFLILLTAVIFSSLAFVLGNYWGLPGILISLAIARLCTNIWYDPYIVFKMGLKYSVINYFRKYIVYLLIIISAIGVTFYLDSLVQLNSTLLHLMFKLITSLIIMNVLVFIVFRRSNELTYLYNFAANFIRTKLKKG